ncbi:hypothetical protein ABBQ38_005843 [Trebouxia sp. C0009 RCD-2024]
MFIQFPEALYSVRVLRMHHDKEAFPNLLHESGAAWKEPLSKTGVPVLAEQAACRCNSPTGAAPWHIYRVRSPSDLEPQASLDYTLLAPVSYRGGPLLSMPAGSSQ